MKKTLFIVLAVVSVSSCKNQNTADKAGDKGGVIVARNFADPNASKFKADSAGVNKVDSLGSGIK